VWKNITFQNPASHYPVSSVMSLIDFQQSQAVFLSAEWRKLVMVNYPVHPELLQPYLPPGTELDFYQNRCLVSVVGFLFLNTCIKGIPIPFHQQFEELNLRFYVRRKVNGTWRRGTVFIAEFVPKFMVSLLARGLYGEPYATRKMDHAITGFPGEWQVTYRWKTSRWNSVSIRSGKELQEVATSSETWFLMEHYWGYNKRRNGITTEYGVEHPRWQAYPTLGFETDIDFAGCYGKDFSILDNTSPSSAFLLEGSPVIVRSGKRIN
jgi:uncharacterized protein YqjF (DUF2071 family)